MKYLAFVAFTLAACASSSDPREPVETFCVQKTFEGSRFTVCDPKSGELRLFASDSPKVRQFGQLMQQVPADHVEFAMNAGMFDEKGAAIGLAVSAGKEVHPLNRRKKGPGNFHMMPNGVFLVLTSGKAEIYPSDAIPPGTHPRLATQSGPMLVIQGELHPAFEPDGRSRYIRNGVGVTGAGKPLFVISQDPVSFGKLARFFRDVLKTPNALYFDGAVSSLWDPANGRMDSHSPLGPIIVALKPAESAPGP